MTTQTLIAIRKSSEPALQRPCCETSDSCDAPSKIATYATLCKRFFFDEEAATAVEYAVMLALLLGTILATIASLGGETGNLWGGIRNNLVAIFS